MASSGTSYFGHLGDGSSGVVGAVLGIFGRCLSVWTYELDLCFVVYLRVFVSDHIEISWDPLYFVAHATSSTITQCDLFSVDTLNSGHHMF